MRLTIISKKKGESAAASLMALATLLAFIVSLVLTYKKDLARFFHRPDKL